MKLTTWGCRGSLPTPGKNTVKYGGNTTCFEIRNNNNDMLVLDAGTGIRELGQAVLKEMPLDVHLLITHTHWDHIMGYPFFVPIFVPGNTINLYGPTHINQSFESVMARTMDYTYFPVRMEELSAKIAFNSLIEGEHKIGNFDVTVKYMNHPILCLGYRVTADDKVIVFSGDHEPYYDMVYLNREPEDEDEQEEKAELEEMVDIQNDTTIEFYRDADILIHDCMYTDQEYPTKIGWGHSSMEWAIRAAGKANVKQLIMSHHDPTRPDDALDELLPGLEAYAKEHSPSTKVSFATEGEVIDLTN